MLGTRTKSCPCNVTTVNTWVGSQSSFASSQPDQKRPDIANEEMNFWALLLLGGGQEAEFMDGFKKPEHTKTTAIGIANKGPRETLHCAAFGPDPCPLSTVSALEILLTGKSQQCGQVAIGVWLGGASTNQYNHKP